MHIVRRSEGHYTAIRAGNERCAIADGNLERYVANYYVCLYVR